MPDRIIRDEILRSHRYVCLPTDTDRLLFFHLLLSADSLGNVEATSTAMTLIMARPIDDALACKLLTHLADVDLVRIYEVDGKRYVHIPRFRQRLRYLNGKHPRPPSNIECIEIKELLGKARLRSDQGLTKVGLQSAEVKRSEVKRSEVKRSEKKKPKAQAPFVLPDWIPQEQWDMWIEARTKVRKPPTERAKHLAVSRLDELRQLGHSPAAVLAESAFNNWSGLFPLKERT